MTTETDAEWAERTARPMADIRVVWMDDTVKTYERVSAAVANDRGELQLSFSEYDADSSRRGSGRPVYRQRVIKIPLVNIRWWGTPGREVAW